MASPRRDTRTGPSKEKLVLGEHFVCRSCKGKGTKKSQPCGACEGRGFTRRETT